MTLKPWTCPKCGTERQFIDHPSVTAWCPCRPRRRTPMTPIDRQPPDDNQGTSTPKRKQKP